VHNARHVRFCYGGNSAADGRAQREAIQREMDSTGSRRKRIRTALWILIVRVDERHLDDILVSTVPCHSIGYHTIFL
jgi:hypothetical protein